MANNLYTIPGAPMTPDNSGFSSDAQSIRSPERTFYEGILHETAPNYDPERAARAAVDAVFNLNEDEPLTDNFFEEKAEPTVSDSQADAYRSAETTSFSGETREDISAFDVTKIEHAGAMFEALRRQSVNDQILRRDMFDLAA